MDYRMKVTITDPNTPKGMMSELFFDLNCHFVFDEEQYGNGHYVSIEGKEFYRQVIDLRYDHSFDPDKKEEWLEAWARSYWSGKNGAWAVKTIEIIRIKPEYYEVCKEVSFTNGVQTVPIARLEEPDVENAKEYAKEYGEGFHCGLYEVYDDNRKKKVCDC